MSTYTDTHRKINARTPIFTVRLPVNLRDQLKEVAAAAGVPAGQYVRNLILDDLEEKESATK